LQTPVDVDPTLRYQPAARVAAADAAGITKRVTPHTLRHGCHEDSGVRELGDTAAEQISENARTLGAQARVGDDSLQSEEHWTP
jgi:integrase